MTDRGVWPAWKGGGGGGFSETARESSPGYCRFWAVGEAANGCGDSMMCGLGWPTLEARGSLGLSMRRGPVSDGSWYADVGDGLSWLPDPTGLGSDPEGPGKGYWRAVAYGW